MGNRAPFLILLLSLAGPASAEDLLQVYGDARQYDAVYASARSSLAAGQEALPQGRALLLPSIGFTANYTQQHIESKAREPALAPLLTFNRDPYARGYTFTLTQPLLRAQNWALYSQAEYQVKQAEATYAQAGQDLILRVAQAYFDVLAAQDTLALVRSQKAAISEQLAQAKRNFEVGTATITDTHEAQARFDLSVAQEIASQNDLESKRKALQQLTGKEYASLKPVRADVKLTPPNPANMQDWVELAQKQSYPVQLQEAAKRIADLDVKRNRAAHLPTIDFVASQQRLEQSGTTVSAFGSNLNVQSIGFQLAMPLFQGGALFSRDRQALALAEKAAEDLDNARRSSALATQQSYLAVVNGVAQVGALEQAKVSSQSALESNKLGYEVGVRINIDVLNAQQQLFSTERDLAVARYNTITNHLRLKAAVGSLGQQDLEEVNRALQP